MSAILSAKNNSSRRHPVRRSGRRPYLMASGSNGTSQMGIDNITFEEPYGLSRVPVERLQVAALAATGMSSCILDSNGTVLTAGLNTCGTLGRTSTKKDEDGDLTDEGEVFEQVPLSSKVTQVDGGSEHYVLLAENGTVYQTGKIRSTEDGSYEEDDSNATRDFSPIPIEGLPGKATMVAAGDSFTAVVVGNRKEVFLVKGYHPIHEKLLDKPTMVPFQSPLADEEEIISLRAGNYHMVAIVLNKETDQTRVFSFGRNMFGQLGHGDTDDKSQFCPILSLDNIVSIACGSTHTVFADKDGNAYGCGSNKYCKLGDATEDKEFLFPTNINLDNSIPSLRVKEVFCGDHCSAFLSSDKQLVLAGSNTSGQLSHDLFKKDILVVSPPMVLPNVECDLFAGGSQHCLFWGKRNPTTALTSTKRKSKRSARTLSDDGLEGDEENNRPATKKAKTESSSRTENNSFFGGVDLWSPEYLRQGYSGTWLCGFCACRTKDSQDTCEVCGQPRH